jgi:hypothetical protein
VNKLTNGRLTEAGRRTISIGPAGTLSEGRPPSTAMIRVRRHSTRPRASAESSSPQRAKAQLENKTKDGRADAWTTYRHCALLPPPKEKDETAKNGAP